MVLVVAVDGTEQQSAKGVVVIYHVVGVSMGLVGSYLPVRTTLITQSTRYGARPEPTLAPQCTRGPPACPAAESSRTNPRPYEKSYVPQEKSIPLLTPCFRAVPVAVVVLGLYIHICLV